MSKVITNIVFTKNRPLQLEAYLRSLYRYFPSELFQTYVIYKKTPEFAEQYNTVFGIYSDVGVIIEKDFHTDCRRLIEEAESKYILFGIDDVVFFDIVEFEVIDKTFDRAGDDIFGFTLRFDKDMLKDSEDVVTNEQTGSSIVHKLDWTQGQTPHTRYPFELCGTFYRSDLVRRILRGCMSQSKLAKRFFGPGSIIAGAASVLNLRRSLLKRFGFFFSPNTLESWLCRWCQQNADSLPRFMYFQKHCASAVQVNVVNTSTVNPADGTAEQTVEALNEKFRRGYRLDIDYLAENPPPAPGCGWEYFKLCKA